MLVLNSSIRELMFEDARTYGNVKLAFYFLRTFFFSFSDNTLTRTSTANILGRLLQ